MNPKHFFITAALLASALPLWAAPQTFMLSSDYGRHQITFESKAPTESIDGNADDFMGQVAFDSAKSQLVSASVRVKVISMETGLALRDKHMMTSEWLNQERFPEIWFELAPGTAVKSKGNGDYFANASGRFFLKGHEKPLTVPVTLRTQGTGRAQHLTIEGRFPVTLENFAIFGPAAMRMIGVRVAPDVQVHFKLIGKLH